MTKTGIGAALILLLNIISANAQDFTSQILNSGSSQGQSVAAGDFDSDGDIDAVISRDNLGTVHWLENRTPLPVLSHLIYQSQAHLRDVAVADFDHDEDDDIIIADYDLDRFIFMRNTTSGSSVTFSQDTLRTNCNGAWGLTAIDIDGDGAIEVATCENISNRVRIFHSVDGNLSEIFVAILSQPFSVYPADIDNDGDQDVLISSNAQGQAGGIYAALQTSPLQFTLDTLVSGLYLTSAAAADFDHDDDLDLVATNYATHEVTLFRKNPNGYAQTVLNGYLNHARSVVVADFNVDGWVDILASAEGSDNDEGELRWWRNNNEGTVFVGAELTGIVRPRDIALTDYDSDGDTDALVTDANTGDLYFYRNMLGTPAYVTGTITTAADNTPLADVLVTVRETGSYDVTDATGHYQIDTAPGSFTVDISHPCWNDTFVTDVETEIGEFSDVTVSLTRPELDLPYSSLNLFAMNNLVTTVELPVINLGNGALTVVASVSGNFSEDEWLAVAPDSASIIPGGTFNFIVTVSPDTTNSGAWDYIGDIELTTNSCPDTIVHVAVLAQILDTDDNDQALPQRFALYPAYPNPFNSTTTIQYALPLSSDVELLIYDAIGRQVNKINYKNNPAGIHAEAFNASGLSSGVYFVTLTAGNFTSSQKLLFIK